MTRPSYLYDGNTYKMSSYWISPLMVCCCCIACNNIMLYPGIIFWMPPANETQCYIVTSSLIGWVHTQNDPCIPDGVRTVPDRTLPDFNYITPFLATRGCMVRKPIDLNKQTLAQIFTEISPCYPSRTVNWNGANLISFVPALLTWQTVQTPVKLELPYHMVN